MSEHTKEQWHHGGTQVSTKEDLIRIFSESIDAHVGDIGQYFMEIYSEDGKRIAFLAGPTAHANARRITASVNACAGLDTEKLERMNGEYPVAEFVSKLEQQRDELLAALELARTTLQDWDGCCTEDVAATFACADELEQIDAAIAKVK